MSRSLPAARTRIRWTATDAPPDGFELRNGFVTEAEEQLLLEQVSPLPLGEVRMHGVTARRKVIHFGWDYGYESWKIERAGSFPPWVLFLRDRAAAFAGIEPDLFEQLLVASYPAGAGIGWHRDAPMFGSRVVGVSLGASCRMRFRRRNRDAGQTYSVTLPERSAYLLSGPARSEWQHSIPATAEARVSLSFRTVRRGWGGNDL